MKDFIPKTKHDDEAIRVLKRTPWEEVLPYADKLLKWVQDMNWPVAGDVAEILTLHTDSIQEHIIGILRGNDGLWKYWCLQYIVRYANKKHVGETLLQELKRLVAAPSEDDIESDVAEAAKEILENFPAA